MLPEAEARFELNGYFLRNSRSFPKRITFAERRLAILLPTVHHKCVVPKPKKQKGARIMKKLFWLSIVVVLLALAPTVAAEDPPACSGLMKALEKIPSDSPGYAKVLEMAQTKCGEALDHAALLALFNATDGPNWDYNPDTNQPADGGNVWDENSHHCTWYGVVCDATSHRVTHILLSYNDLNGYIPDELMSLTNLGWLWLHGDNNQWGWPTNDLACWETQEVLNWAEGLSGTTYVNQHDLPGGGTGATTTGVICGSGS
jgi:hypothetical protein